MKYLLPVSQDLIDQIQPRSGETKLGERMTINGRDKVVSGMNPGFVVLGIPEDIGPRANKGRGGAHGMWDVFLPRLMNMQSNRFLSGEEILIAGTVDCSYEMKKSEAADRDELLQLTAKIDQKVKAACLECLKSGAIPIVIGGGHNNAYGIISAVATHFGKAISAINIDPHADFRACEGRHSGNGFSYAFSEKLLHRYFVLGLHESFNSTYILEQLGSHPELDYCSFDDFLRGKISLKESCEKAILHCGKTACGLELDLDSIAGFPTSAQTESGWTADQARQLILQITSAVKPLYLHLPEGAPAFEEAKAGIHGKTVAYLVTDFMKAHIFTPSGT